MAGIVAPDSFPIRDPRDAKQTLGRCLNPPRYQKSMGGMTGPGKWPKGNDMAVEAPTNVKAAHSSARKNVE